MVWVWVGVRALVCVCVWVGVWVWVCVCVWALVWVCVGVGVDVCVHDCMQGSDRVWVCCLDQCYHLRVAGDSV